MTKILDELAKDVERVRDAMTSEASKRTNYYPYVTKSDWRDVVSKLLAAYDAERARRVELEDALKRKRKHVRRRGGNFWGRLR